MIHAKFVGSGLHFRGREGILVEKNPKGSRLLLNYPHGVPIEDVWFSNRDIEAIDPPLAFPPLHLEEFFMFLHYEWDIAKAWRIIRKDRPVFNMPLHRVDEWHERYLKGVGDPEVWEVMPNGGQRRVSGGGLEGLISIDPSKAMSDSTDLSIPLIMGRLYRKNSSVKEPGVLLLDGYHRLHKAFKLRKGLSVYILEPPETELITWRGRKDG